MNRASVTYPSFITELKVKDNELRLFLFLAPDNQIEALPPVSLPSQKKEAHLQHQASPDGARIVFLVVCVKLQQVAQVDLRLAPTELG